MDTRFNQKNRKQETDNESYYKQIGQNIVCCREMKDEYYEIIATILATIIAYITLYLFKL